MNNIKYKYVRLLTEGYNFTNADEVMSAVKANQIGVKIDQSFKTDQGSIPTKLAFKHFFEKCQSLGIKDTTYGVQILLSKTTRETIGYAVAEDAIYEFLRSYRKPWVKQLPEYKLFMDGKYNKDVWHNLEKAIQNNQTAHGKVAKGGGQIKDVKVAYDDGTWKLLIPSSFEGEKAAAFYFDTKTGKEVPTEWCTRCDKYYYDHYTERGPLFIIRNMKNGNSYQLAFMANKIEFLDQFDEKGDEITHGDLTKIPDNLLKLIKDPRNVQNPRTLLDYKEARKELGKIALPKKGYLSPNENISSGNPNSPDTVLGKPISLGDGVFKREFLNYSDDKPKDLMRIYFERFAEGGETPRYKTEKLSTAELKYAKKHKATVYYHESDPKATYTYTTSATIDGKRELSGEIIQSENFYKKLPVEIQGKVMRKADEDFGYAKHADRQDAKAAANSTEKADNKINEKYEEIVDAVNRKVDFSKSDIFESLLGMGIPRFKDRLGRAKIVPRKFAFQPKREWLRELRSNRHNDTISVEFKEWDDEEDEDVDLNELNKNYGEVKLQGSTMKDVDFLKGNCVYVVFNDWAQIFDKTFNPKEYNLLRSVAKEVMKEFLKIDEFRNKNLERKILDKKDGVKRPELYESVNYFPY